MKKEEVFAAALGLKSPWYIAEIELREVNDNKKELHLYVDHEKGALFDYEGELYPVYDHMNRIWRYLNFFEHECYLQVCIPRVKLKDNSVRQVKVPWAMPGSSFTLLFEDFAMRRVRLGLSNSACGRLLNIDGRRIGNIIRYRVSMALATEELDQVKHLSIDEVSAGKGHTYLTILSDRERKIVVEIGRGKDSKAVEETFICKEVRGSDREDVRSITMDMSRAFIGAAADKMEQADIIFDRYHIVAKLNEAIDKVNLSIQEIKRIAKGYRNDQNLMHMIYFHLGGLDLSPSI